MIKAIRIIFSTTSSIASVSLARTSSTKMPFNIRLLWRLSSKKGGVVVPDTITISCKDKRITKDESISRRIRLQLGKKVKFNFSNSSSVRDFVSTTRNNSSRLAMLNKLRPIYNEAIGLGWQIGVLSSMQNIALAHVFSDLLNFTLSWLRIALKV